MNGAKKIACGVVACAAAMTAGAADVTVDFSRQTGEINPRLHSSGCAPCLYPRAIRNDDAQIKAMGCYATRTHDWALWNNGQRIVDTHFIFPLMHLDPKDPKNYYFKATDEALRLSKDLGLKILYRLGSSIEHTDGVHFNVLDPEDHEKYAEVLAGIMRHYLKGWAGGFEWSDAFQGWEIWNEPDGTTNCYVIPDCKETDWLKRMDLHKPRFCHLFATVLKRLKSEFPDQQIGGPALCSAREDYFRTLLQACRDAGVAPDFISWHGYGDVPESFLSPIPKMRAMLDEFGFTKTRMVIDEWHYLRNSDWNGVHGGVPVAYRRAHDGPSGLCNIDSAAFNVYMLSKFQDTALDEAYWDAYLAAIRPYPDAAETLSALRSRGVRIGLGTNMTAGMQFRKLERLGLADFFDFAVTSEETGVEKPAPEFFAACAAKAGCPAGRCLFVGDNPDADVRGALGAGLRAVWFAPDPAKRAAHPDLPSVASLSGTLEWIRPVPGRDEERIP